jgi:PAS domain S-box-containing protein
MMVENYEEWKGKVDIFTGRHRFGSVLEVPLRWQQEGLGVLYIDDVAGRKFSEEEARLLSLFADQAAISLASSDLLTSDSQKLQRLERLAQSSQKMMSDLEGIALPDRLTLIAQHATEILQAEACGVFFVRGGELSLEGSYGQKEEFVPGARRLKIHGEEGQGLTGFIASTFAQGAKIFKRHGDDLKNHPAVAGNAPHTPSEFCYSLLTVPLRRRVGDHEEFAGLLRVDNKKGKDGHALATLGFTQEDDWILAIFAEAAVVAIESAELVDRLKERKDYQDRLIASSPNGIIAVNEQGKVNVFNTRAEEILGFTREEVLGKPVHPLYFDPEEPRRIAQMLDNSPEHRVGDYSTYVRSKHNERIPILHSSTWLYNTQNQRIGSVGYFEDLRAQEATQNRERLLLQASDVVARASILDEGLEMLATMMVSLLERSFCSILLKDDSGDFLILRAVNIADNQKQSSPRDQSIALAEWLGLPELLEAGLPTVRRWSDERARPNLKRLSHVLKLETDIHYLLVVPLKIGARVVGQIDLGELNASPNADFDLEEIDLVSAIGVQITVLVDRLRLLETTEHREKLLKKLVQASAQVRADMELPTLTQSIARLGAELVEAEAGALFPYRPRLGEIQPGVLHGSLEEFVGEIPTDSLIDRVARSGDAQTASHSATDPLLQQWGLRRAAAVPLRQASGEVESVLMVGDTAEGLAQFRQADLEVLQLFANQASSTMQISLLIDSERRTFSKLAILHRISDYIQEVDDLGRVFHAVLTGVTASYGLRFNRAALLLIDDTGENLVGRMGIGEVVAARARAVWRSDEALGLDNFDHYLKWIVQQKEPVELVTTVGRQVLGMRLPMGGDDLFSEVIRTRQCLRIDPGQLPRVPSTFVDELKVTSTLAVAPLVAKDEVIGILVVDNKVSQAPIGRDDLESLMTFAATAAVALENKRLLMQARSGSDMLLSFYEANSELIKISDPRQILQSSVEQTLAASGAWWVSILLIDELGRARNPIAVGKYRAFVPEGQDLVRKDGISMKVMNSGQAIAIENIARSLHPVNPSMVAAGAQAALCFPLTLPGKRIGVMWIHYAEPRRFPQLEVAALQLYVNQAATAYDNARRIEQLESLREAFDALAQAADTASVLEEIVGCARRVLRIEAAIVWAYDENRDTFILDSSRYSGPNQRAWAEFRKVGPQQRGTAYTIMHRGWVAVGDVRDPLQNQLLGPATQRFLERIGGNSLQGVVLRVGDERLGVLYAIYGSTALFAEEEREAAITFANHAALAWKKAKLLDQVKRSNRAADAVARVTALGKREATLKAIAQETMEAVDCSAVVLFEYSRRNGSLIHPPTMVGVHDEEAAASRAEISDHPLVYHMLEQDRPYILESITADARFATRFARDEKIESCAAVALKAADRKVGVMFVNYREQHRFTQDELTNIELFANQAAVALHNTQLFDELNRKLREQRALSDLSRKLLGTTDLQETMDRAVEAAAEALETEFANIVLPDLEGRLIFSAGFGWEKELIGVLELEKGEGSQTGYTIQQGRPIAVYDYRSVKFRVPDLVFAHGIHSGLSVPMIREGRIVGSMLVHTRRLRRFTKDDEELLVLIANDTALAIQNARQYEASVRKSAYLKALYLASKEIAASVGLDRRQLLEQIIQRTASGITGIDGPKAVLGTIQLRDSASNALVFESVYPSHAFPDLVARLGERRSLNSMEGRIGVTGRVVRTGRPWIVKDVTTDPDYVCFNNSTQSEIALPLLEQGEVIGVLNIESDRLRAFDEEDRDALESLARLTVIALQGSRHYEELQRTRGLVAARTALALMWSDNHDLARFANQLEVQLHSLRKNLGRAANASPCAEILGDVDMCAWEIKEILNRTRGSVAAEVASVALGGMLQQCAERLRKRHPGQALEIRVSLDDLRKKDTVRANGSLLSRAFEILINNAIEATKGAPQGRVEVAVRRTGKSIEVTVSDNGQGISEEIRKRLLVLPIDKPPGSQGMGMGLLIARAIVQSYDGDIRCASWAPGDTSFAVSLPIEA